MSDAVRGAIRRTAPGLVVTIAILLGGQLLDVAPSIRYGAGLVAFTLWMVWFVMTFVQWFGWTDEEH
ncbi:hypothetical protein [Haloarchaeobius sp. DFWS5]|uniref:hypothetical protein n=1 Tax=Haloarchaeobius sp. DFWS5 TaxID=3446114 RepID=UPI003EB97D29